jgi:hypothetical protein
MLHSEFQKLTYQKDFEKIIVLFNTKVLYGKIQKR